VQPQLVRQVVLRGGRASAGKRSSFEPPPLEVDLNGEQVIRRSHSLQEVEILNPSRLRANRTHTEEFYELTDAETGLASLQAALRDWETVYNTVRPQQALGYPTPAEYLASVGVEV